MIKEIKKYLKKYENISKHSEYVSVTEVINDFYRLGQEARLKRIPKHARWTRWRKRNEPPNDI